jgi:outer membrane autotransporter protein
MVMLAATSGVSLGQTYFIGNQSGDWNQGTTWGNHGNVAGTDYPSGYNDVLIRTGTVTVTDAESVDAPYFMVQSGSALVIANGGSLTTNGYLYGISVGNGTGVPGRMNVQAGGSFAGNLYIDPVSTNLVLGDQVGITGLILLNNTGYLNSEVDATDHATINSQIVSQLFTSTAGLQKTGTGTLTLTNSADQIPGGTQILQGTLEATTSGALDTTAVTVSNTGTLSLNLANGETFANNITDNNQVVLGGALGNDYTLTGAILGSGSVIKTGANTVTLQLDPQGPRDNFLTYTGVTEIEFGKLVVAGTVSEANYIDGGGIIVRSGAELVDQGVSIASNVTISGQGAGDGGAIFLANNAVGNITGTLTLAGDATIKSDAFNVLELAGEIDLGSHTLDLELTDGDADVFGPVTGTGGITIGPCRSVTFDGPMAYTGRTTVEAGGSLTLQAWGSAPNTGASISGDVLDSGAIYFYASNQLSSTTVLTLEGAGHVGFLILLGELNPYSERLAGIDGTSTDAQFVSASPVTLTLDGSGNYSFAGQLFDYVDGYFQGDLSLMKTGTGTQVLTGANTYAGGTTVSGGVLQIGDGVTQGATAGTGDVTINDTGTFKVDLATGETFANSIHDNNAVILDDSQNSTYTVSSQIDGTGSVTKTGASAIYLANANRYSGGTTISDGALIVGNTFALGTGPVVNNAMLMTNSSVHGLTVSVSGDFTNGPTGVLRLAIYGAGDYDSIQLTNPASVAHLGGELLIALPADVETLRGQRFALVTSSNPIDGRFDLVATTLPSVGAVVTYTDNATITLQLAQLPFANLAHYSPNELAVARGVDANLQGGPLTPLIGALNELSVSPSALAAAFDQLTPLKFGQFTGTTAANNASFATEARDNYLASQRTGAGGTFAGGNGSIDASGLTLNDPSYDPSLAMVHSRMLAWNPAPYGAISDSTDALLGGMDMRDPKDMKAMAGPAYNNPWNFYIAGNVVLAQGFSQNDVAHFDSNTESVTLGTDYRLTPNFLIGLAAGYGHTDVTLDTNGSSATVDTYSPGIYASYADHGWNANFSGDYLHNAYTQSRAISFLGQTANSAPEGNEGVVNLDGGYDFHHGAWTFGPLAGLQYTHLTVDGYSEGGSVADLTVSSQDTDSLRSRLGGRVSFTYARCGMTFTPHLDASWQHEFLNQARGITSQFTGAVGSFSVQTTNPSRDSALIDLGLDAQINRTVTAFGDYEVQAGQDNYFGQSVQAGVKIGF